MRILLLADLHFQENWYHWLARQNPDITVISGDLLDGFIPEGLLPQMLAVSAWCERFPGPLVVSSGNHDANSTDGIFDPDGLALISAGERERVMRMLTAMHWMDCLERPGLVTDGRTAVLETLRGAVVVTTIPFDFGSGGDTDGLWREGALKRKSLRVPWLVLHHEPPADTMVGGQMGEPSLFYKIQEYRPNFVVSGHMHDQPYRGSFADNIEGTWCFNPGYPSATPVKRAKIPNHIVLDLSDSTATWYATGSKGPIHKTISLK